MWRRLACMLLLITASGLRAHHGDEGHQHENARVWKDVDGRIVEASFVIAREGKVLLAGLDGVQTWMRLDRFCRVDQDWVARRMDEIRILNELHFGDPAGMSSASASPGWIVLGTMVGFVGLSLAVRRRQYAMLLKLASFAALSTMLACTGKQETQEIVAHADGQPPAIVAHFKAFQSKLKFRWNDTTLFIDSNGMPDHAMMIGITNWQQQVPLPQPYAGTNAWQIPLKPRMADTPISAKRALYRGAIALAVNGVPIFNALNNRGEDAFLIGELDQFGGHCGKGDDYHYHAAPLHLQKLVGEGNPIGYALDGYPLYGLTDQKLDEFNGRFDDKGDYRYHSTKTYPYINGGLKGVVEVRNDAVEPQPRAAPLRPAGAPLRGAKITGFTVDAEQRKYSLKYEVNEQIRRINYQINANGSVSFVFIDERGKEQAQTYERREGKGDEKKKDDKKKKGKGKDEK